MGLAQTKFVPYEMKASMVQIISYEGKSPKGFLVNPFYEGPRYFENLTQLLFLIEDMQNALSYPQKCMESRQFYGEKRTEPLMTEQPEHTEHPEPIATFKISVLFRQNASWQGTVVWMDRQTEAQFRSVLELIMLMDSVLAE